MASSVDPSAPASGRIDHDDQLALGIAAVDLASGQRHDGGLHLDEALRPGLDQDAGDLAAGRRHHPVRPQQAARDEGPTINCAARCGHVGFLEGFGISAREGRGPGQHLVDPYGEPV